MSWEEAHARLSTGDSGNSFLKKMKRQLGVSLTM
jgi:hypothetical protein